MIGQQVYFWGLSAISHYFIISIMLTGNVLFFNSLGSDDNSNINLIDINIDFSLNYIINTGEFPDNIICYTTNHELFLTKNGFEYINGESSIILRGNPLDLLYIFEEFKYNVTIFFHDDVYKSPVYSKIKILDDITNTRFEISMVERNYHFEIISEQYTEQEFCLSSNNHKLLQNNVVGYENTKIFNQNNEYILPVTLNTHTKSTTFSIKSTFLGGSEDDRVAKIFNGEDGYTYVVGYTYSYDFPTQNSIKSSKTDSYDAFVTKINKELNTIIFSTYIGGSSLDRVDDIIVKNNEIFLIGTTSSTDFPISANNYSNVLTGEQDIFLMKLNRDGSSIVYSTYLGGSEDDSPRIIREKNNMIYIGGKTQSSDFPITGNALQKNLKGNQDIFLLIFDLDSSNIIYSSFLGGTSSDSLIDMKLNGDLVYITGSTSSSDYPITPLGFDRVFGGTKEGLFSVFNFTTNSITYSTFIGGSSFESMSDMAITEDSIYLSGYSDSNDFPIFGFDTERPSSGNTDVFVMSLSLDTFELNNIKFFGGSSGEDLLDLMISEHGVYICGSTSSNNFQTTVGSFQPEFGGIRDGFIMKLSLDLNNIYYSSYIGGWAGDLCYSIHNWDYTITISGVTYSSDFPIETGGYDDSYNDEMDIFIIKMQIITYPLNPTNITCEPSFNGFYINWSEPIFDGYNDIIGYDVYKSLNNGTLELLHDNIDSVSIYDTDIIPGQYVTYSVSAVNEIGESQFSTISRKFIVKPSEPRSIIVTEGDGYCIVKWDSPTSNGGAPILSYELYRNSTNNDFELIHMDHSLMKEYNDTDVINGITYKYKLKSKNIIGSSNFSDSISGKPYGIPDHPIVMINNSGNGFIRLEWQHPDKNGGRDISLFSLYYGTNEVDLDKISTFDNSTYYYNHSGLNNGIEYFYSITSTNIRGESERSPIVSSIPYGLPSTPIDVTYESGDEFIHLSWNHPVDDGGSKIIKYSVYKKTYNSDYFLYQEVEELTINDTDVINGDEYYYKIFSNTAIGQSLMGYEISVIPYGLPNPPNNFSIDALDKKNILQWNQPDNDGGSPISSYQIFRGSDENSLTLLKEVNKGINLYEDTGLNNGEIYYYLVKSKTAIGESLPTAIIIGIPLGLPSEPLDLNYIIEGRSVVLNWKSPNDDGGVNVSFYRIYMSSDGSDFKKIGEVSGEEKSFTEINLKYDIEYKYYITAVNIIGESETSSQIMFSIEKPTQNEFPIITTFLIIFSLLLLGSLIGVIFVLKRKNKINNQNLNNEDTKDIDQLDNLFQHQESAEGKDP